MNVKKLRTLVPLVVLVAVGVGFAAHAPIGNLSAFGWKDISILCPLGALGTMLATKTLLPRAVVSLAIAAIVIALLGRAFCGWVCPVPIVSKLRGFVSKKSSNADLTGTGVLPAAENPFVKKGDAADDTIAPLADEERGCSPRGCAAACSSCAQVRERFDSRHLILGGSLLSAAIFGFPVFCLICPIGLSCATIAVLMRLFMFGDVAWGVIAIPAVLLIEVVLFRKWCSKLCPLSALMSLVGKLNRTFVPAVDDEKCREACQGASCEACAAVCPQGINVRHPEAGASFSECIKCRSCVEACPTNAVSMPALPRKRGRNSMALESKE